MIKSRNRRRSWRKRDGNCRREKRKKTKMYVRRKKWDGNLKNYEKKKKNDWAKKAEG